MSKQYELSLKYPRFKIAGEGFSTSREAATGTPREFAEPLEVVISDGTHVGYGECLPYKHYKESLESVTQQIEAIRDSLEDGLSREELLKKLPAGAARNAVDAALWDLECKQSKKSAWEMASIERPNSLKTVYTLSVASPEKMVKQLKDFGDVGTIKMKLSGNIDEDIKRIQAVHRAAPHSEIVVDANEAMKTEADYHKFIAAAQKSHVTMIEQPFPASDDELLLNLPRPIPLCADESFRSIEDIPMLAKKYDIVNIKLDKAGGLTQAIKIQKEAQKHGLEIMVGTMLASSLSMAPAYLLAARGATFIDLDSPMLLEEDRNYALNYEGDTLYPPSAMLWGGASREKAHKHGSFSKSGDITPLK